MSLTVNYLTEPYGEGFVGDRFPARWDFEPPPSLGLAKTTRPKTEGRFPLLPALSQFTAEKELAWRRWLRRRCPAISPWIQTRFVSWFSDGKRVNCYLLRQSGEGDD